MKQHCLNKLSEVVIKAVVPDVCRKGSTIVAVYSYAYGHEAVNFSPNVNVNGCPALTRATIIPRSYGTEGCDAGVVSGKPTCGPCRPITDAQTVKGNSNGVVKHDGLWEINHANCVGKACHPGTVLLSVDVNRGPWALWDNTPDSEDDRALAKKRGISEVRQVQLEADGYGASQVGDLSAKSEIVISAHASDLAALGADKLAEILVSNGFRGGSIELFSCNGVSLETGKKLDEALKQRGIDADVAAYDGFVGINKEGKVFVRWPTNASKENPPHETWFPKVEWEGRFEYPDPDTKKVTY